MTSNNSLLMCLSSSRRTITLRSSSLILLLVVVGIVGGCTRAHYRRQADREVNAIIDDKALALGVQGFMRKPVKAPALVKEMERILNRSF